MNHVYTVLIADEDTKAKGFNYLVAHEDTRVVVGQYVTNTEASDAAQKLNIGTMPKIEEPEIGLKELTLSEKISLAQTAKTNEPS